MKRVLLFVLFGALAALAARDECGPCDPDACRTPDSCLAGLVKDACGCCMVCGQREGHRCYHRSVAGSWEHGPCGEDLDCRPRADLAPGDPAEALCVCNKAWPMCGSDGVTYDSVCQLTEARYSRRDGLEAASRGPCMAVGKTRRSSGDSESLTSDAEVDPSQARPPTRSAVQSG
ncbi:Kazal-type serine protease inhibitor domain containing protein [Ixodes scapularis]|uniref:Kazal-type serine protease inhibitor domain containing protein n=1 Tax=Ixodes scapularis TaxID=6945 RepID=B7PBJ8_IXOSC|nr:Kazal-type serine protease inhibitor domain containing protein [Ixodes scapularis]|eukprot:XP_002408307.1 Kazal-type serine protease inhibitor domain containing protein [Ixodes scapularis]